MSLKTWVASEKLNASDLNGRFADVGDKDFIAGENLTAGDAVSLSLYTSTPITYDAAGSGNGTLANGSGQDKTVSITIGSDSNRVLLVSVVANATSISIVSADLDGVEMTAVGSATINAGTTMKMFRLFAPASGAGTVTVTFNTAGTGYYAIVAQSFYNVAQSIDSSNTANATNTCNLTPVADGVVAFTAFARTGTSISPSVNSANNNEAEVESTQLEIVQCNSGVIFPNKVTTVTATGAEAVIVCGIAPYSTAIVSVQKADTSNLTNICNPNLYNNFLGFADESVSVEDNVLVRLCGVEDNQVDLVVGSEYYLSDTPGDITTSVGTNEKKVGIAISSTEILIKNENI